MAPVPISLPIAVIFQAKLVSESLHWLFPLPVPFPKTLSLTFFRSQLFKAAPTAFPCLCSLFSSRSTD